MVEDIVMGLHPVENSMEEDVEDTEEGDSNNTMNFRQEADIRRCAIKTLEVRGHSTADGAMLYTLLIA